MDSSGGPQGRGYQVGGAHYVSLAVQPWDAMRAWLSPPEWRGFLRGNAIKYLARAGTKGSAREDLEKAAHYLAELIASYDGAVPPCPTDLGTVTGTGTQP